VTVADGTPEMAQRLNRVLTNDPGIGVARHVDAGYEEAVAFAQMSGIEIPVTSRSQESEVRSQNAVASG
jgi:urocanate hydratase